MLIRIAGPKSSHSKAFFYDFLLCILWVPIQFTYTKIEILFETMWFSGPSTKNHAESYENYVHNSFLDPKGAKIHEKSLFRHVQESRASPGPVQKDRSLLACQA